VKSQVISFSLPFVVLLVIPAVILIFTGGIRWGWGLGQPCDAIIITIGTVFIVAGIYLLACTIILFIKIGKGTLAPWSPTQNLVVAGPYRHTRNPMISGVLIALLGETVVTGSIWLLVWSAIFFIVNHFYFVYSEEPGLVKRFGENYLRYKDSVPRWFPKFTPWKNG
jgi:protein-S-isoprenylcysteine O-methyltransferase Ste14